MKTLTIFGLFLIGCNSTQGPDVDPNADIILLSRSAAEDLEAPAFEDVEGELAEDFDLSEDQPNSDDMAVVDIQEEGEPETVEPTGLAENMFYVPYVMRRGESLAHFARWAKTPVEEIAAESGLPLDGNYPVGTEIILYLTGEGRSTVETRRDAHHQTRAESYLATRGGALGTDFYSVKTGDSAWNIAKNEIGVPLWLIESFNPSVDLDAIQPGQQLMVPVLADVVVDAQ